jgi:hypothetical protein
MGSGRIVETTKGARIPEGGPLADMTYCNGRTVYVMLDANVATNGKVQQAERTLVAELGGRE